MIRELRNRWWTRVGYGLGLVAAVFAGYQWHRWPGHTNSLSPSADRTALNDQALAALWAKCQSEAQVHAATASTGETFAMATGAIDEDVEGLFVLDFITGELQCAVLNYRTGRFTSVFRRDNVQADLGVDPAKRPKYLMTTGMINFPRGASAARPGNSVVYVMDTSTGAFAAYAIPWRRELASIGRPQASAMILMDVGRARTAAIRE